MITWFWCNEYYTARDRAISSWTVAISVDDAITGRQPMLLHHATSEKRLKAVQSGTDWASPAECPNLGLSFFKQHIVVCRIRQTVSVDLDCQISLLSESSTKLWCCGFGLGPTWKPATLLECLYGDVLKVMLMAFSFWYFVLASVWSWQNRNWL